MSLYGNTVFSVSFCKLVILCLVGKERLCTDIIATVYTACNIVLYLCYIECFTLCTVCGTYSYKVKSVFGAGTLGLKTFVESGSELRKEIQRTAEVNYIAFNSSALRQTCNGLVNNSVEYACRNVSLCRTLIEKRLNIRLCKNTATRSDRVNLILLLCNLVKLKR